MFKTKFVAMLLCITTVFAMFAGVSFAESNEEFEEIVIENGKLVSGSSELIDKGFIILGDPEDSEVSEEAEDNTADLEYILDNMGGFFKPAENRVEVKDDAVSVGGGVSTPSQTPNAVSPSVPTQTESAIPAINHEIAITNPGTADYLSNYYTNDSTTAYQPGSSNGIFTYSGTVGTTTSTRVATLKKNAHIYLAVIYRMSYQVYINSALTLELSYDRSTYSGVNYSTARVPRGLNRFRTGGNYMFEVTNGGTLRIVGGNGGNDISAGKYDEGGIDNSDKFIIDANGGDDRTTSSGNAPAFYVDNATLEIKNAIIRDSLSGTSNGKGAAIHVRGGGKVYLENVVFDNCGFVNTSNTSSMGGAIHILGSGSVTLKNCRITDTATGRTNYACDGGAISIANSATSASGCDYLLQIEDTIIEDSRSTSNASSTRGGGAIYVGTLASGQKISIKDSTIQNCYTAGNGGAIHMESGGSLEMEGTTIQNCYSTLAEVENSGTAAGGGGMYIDTTGTVTMTNCTIQNCYAQNGDGGGIFVDTATLNLTGCNINNNYISDTSSTYTYTLNGASKSLCAPLKTGAAIYAQEAANVTLTNTKVNNNQEGAAKIARGAIYITRRAVVTMGGTSEISNNKGGGGVYIYSKGTFTMNGGTMSGNEYIYHNPTYGLSGYSIGNYGMSNGVAVLLHAETAANYGTFTMNGGTIKNHTNTTSLKGGAIGLMGGGSIEIKGGNIESNTVSTSTTFKTRSGTTVTYDHTTSFGGAIYIESGVAEGVLNISGGTIGGTTAAKGNSAGVGGGVFMGESTTLTMDGGTISNNKATSVNSTASNLVKGGGGIYAGKGSDVYIKAGTISANSNVVGGNGGGGGIAAAQPNHLIIGDENDATKCPQIINNNSICDGGGVYAINSGVLIYNCSISNNYSKHGGGLYVTNTTGTYYVTMHGGSIDNNENSGVFLAGQNGATVFTMNGGSISGNTIHKTDGHDYGGAGICSINGHSVTINGGTINGNKNLDEDVSTAESSDTARNGGGIAMVQSSSGVGTLTITGGTISNNETVGNGGGIFVEDGGILSIKGTASNRVTISGNKALGFTNSEGTVFAGLGGGIHLGNNKGTATDGSAVVISYATISGNEASFTDGDGGGIYCYETNLDISYSTISGNKVSYNSGSNGGGICIPMGGYTLNVDNCTFSDNEGKWGGGLYCAFNSIVNINDTTFNGNKGTQGGGVMLYTTGTAGTATFKNVYMGNNSTTSDAGGAISVHGYNLSLENCNIGWIMQDEAKTIAPNSTGYVGGGLYIGPKTVLSLGVGVDISNNQATSSGGGIYFVEDAKVPEFVGVNFSNNKAAKNGGAISVAYSAISASNTLVFKGCTFTNNTAGGNGGAIRSTNAVLTVNNNEVAGSSVMRGNEAGGRGGAVYAVNTTGAAPSVANFFKLSGTLYENNKANTDKTGNDGYGGAIYLSCANGYITNNEFYGNCVYVSPVASGSQTVDGNGGAVYVIGTESANSRLEFSINTVGKNGAGNTADCYGGGLAIGGNTTAAILRGSFSYNHAKDGGGIYAFECKDGLLITPYISEVTTFLTRSDSGVTDNVSADALYTIVQNNYCSANGGGLHLSTNATIKNLKLLNNSCGFDGGGMSIQDGKVVTMTGLNTVGGNSAASYGGGIIIRPGGKLTVEGNAAGTLKTVIDGNKVFGSNTGGAGVHVASGSTFTMSYGEITNNDASKTAAGADTTSHGGGVDITGGFATLTGVTVTGNKSGGNGGGISLDDYDNDQGSLTATNCVISGNSSGANGGGIAVADHTTASIGSTVVMDNTAANGGGVSVGDYASVTMTSSYIVENTANGTMAEGGTTMSGAVSGVGGGVAVFDGSSFSLTGTGAIYNNKANVAANDVFANGSSTSLSIPAASAMDTNGATLNGVAITAFNAEGKTTGWWEDYKNGDTNYESGLFGDIPPAFRYEDGPVSVPAYTTAAESTRYINEAGRFVSITFDVQKYNVGSITITAPDSDDANQRFVFTISGTTIKNETVNMSISLLPGKSVTIEKLYPGTYTITQETSWSWRYDFDGVTVDGGVVNGTDGVVTVEIEGVSVVETHSVEYDNVKGNDKWLNHNSVAETNKATQVAYVIDMAEAKKVYMI